MNIHHATGTVGRNDHETVVLTRWLFGIGVLAYRGDGSVPGLAGE
jgi:hypothetical protein